MTSIVCGKLGTCSSAACFHKIQTTSSMEYLRFVTSMSGVARKLYNSLGSKITLVCFLSFLSFNFPHIELRLSLARPRFAALHLEAPYLIVSFHSAKMNQNNAPRPRGFEPSRDNRLHRFQFQECVYIIQEYSPLALSRLNFVT